MPAMVATFYLFVVLFDFIPLIKNKKGNKKEIWVYSIFLLASLVINGLASVRIYVPSPIRFIESIIDSFKPG